MAARFFLFYSYHVVLGNKIFPLKLLPKLGIDQFRSLLQILPILLVINTLPPRHAKDIIQKNHGLLVTFDAHNFHSCQLVGEHRSKHKKHLFLKDIWANNVFCHSSLYMSLSHSASIDFHSKPKIKNWGLLGQKYFLYFIL